MSGYPKATCDPGTVALRLANERADRWKQRHDALAARLASVKALADERDVKYPERWEFGSVENYIAGYKAARADLRAVLGSDAHTEQKGAGA